MKSFLISIILIIVFFSISAQADDISKSSATISTDSVKVEPIADSIAVKEELLPLDHFVRIMSRNFVKDPSNTRVSVFGNHECGRCTKITEFLADVGVKFTEYDIQNKTYRSIMHKLVYFVNGKPLGFSFPVVVVDDRVYYNIQRIDKFNDEVLEEIKQK
ncbi:MAG: glutaredoxin domain-containing protein [Candidatus Kapabacteria bacterium]|jgi:glutaredoxin|nr:glutaredoxin domain-containing protein [Candidatus Kapabacteria bacterium]